jgi:hypothetical protein
VSIWASSFAIEDERQWIAGLEANGIKAGVIRDGEPIFDDLDAPIIYQGSHILPDEDNDPRGGSVDLALVPQHITRDGRDNGDTPWPYLRLGVDAADSTYGGGGSATVVLTQRQARRLRDALSQWLKELPPTCLVCHRSVHDHAPDCDVWRPVGDETC